MDKFHHDEGPVRVSRDAGYSKAKLLSQENIEKSKERINNPDIVTGKYKLKELLGSEYNSSPRCNDLLVQTHKIII